MLPLRSDVEHSALTYSPLHAKYGIGGVPTGILIDRQGNVAGIFRAGYEPDEPLLQKLLNETSISEAGHP
jgi:hypothetical protein